jgi:hypothetical protein
MFVREAKRLLFPEPMAVDYAPVQRAVAAQYQQAAERRLRPARDLAPPAPPLVAAFLLRDAVALLVRAVAATRDRDADHSSIARLDTVATLGDLRRAAHRQPDDDSLRVDESLTTTDPLYLDALDPADLTRLHFALEREAQWLRGLVDLRSAVNKRATRLGRLAALALVVLYLAAMVVAKAWSRPNLAFHKPVLVSSQQPGTPDPAGLVDGKKGGTYGLHTDIGARDPWAMVDLQRDAEIHEIVVYNRGDRNLNDGLPYTLELSLDGREFHEVARRDTPFGDGGFLSPPWSARIRGHARFVRVRANGYIALSELEVY